MNEKDLDTAIEKCERIMEFDIRTMQNPVSENGWIFEKVYELLQYLRGLQFAADTNVATTDIISRAAVVDAIEGVDWYHMTDSGEMVHGANSDEHQAWYKADDIYKAIESVPSAQLAQDLPKGCTDTISRVAAISICDNAIDLWNGQLGTGALVAVRDAIMALPSAQPGWIPTSVKPPEPFKLVLIQDYCGCYELNTYIPPRINPKQYPNGYWGEVGTVDFDYFDVEAWCPLPAPYIPEGDDKHEG